MTTHDYAKGSMISTLLAFGVTHQQDMQVVALVVSITAGIISIIKAVTERKK